MQTRAPRAVATVAGGGQEDCIQNSGVPDVIGLLKNNPGKLIWGSRADLADNIHNCAVIPSRSVLEPALAGHERAFVRQGNRAR